MHNGVCFKFVKQSGDRVVKGVQKRDFSSSHVRQRVPALEKFVQEGI